MSPRSSVGSVFKSWHYFFLSGKCFFSVCLPCKMQVVSHPHREGEGLSGCQ